MQNIPYCFRFKTVLVPFCFVERNTNVNFFLSATVAYTPRYSSGPLIPIFQTVAVAELGIKGPLEHLQALLFIYDTHCL